MALSHLLDTSVYSQPMKPRPLAAVRDRWDALGDEFLAISTICEAEILFGLELKGSDRLRALYDELLKGRLRVLPVDSGIARHFASLKAWARQAGRPSADFDLLMLATAKAHNLTVATLNARHFRDFPGVGVEDWSE